MADAWVGVVGALGGVLVGAFAEGFRARAGFKRERSWDFFREEQRRLEEIYIALEQVRESYGGSVTPVLVMLTTSHTLEQRKDGPSVPWARLRMLVFMHAVQLKERLAVVERTGLKLGEVMAKGIVSRSQDLEKNKKWGDVIMKANDNLDAAINAMRDDLIAHGNQLAAGAKADAGYAK